MREAASPLHRIGKCVAKRRSVDIGCPETVARLKDTDCRMRADIQAVSEENSFLADTEYQFAHKSGEKTVG